MSVRYILREFDNHSFPPDWRDVDGTVRYTREQAEALLREFQEGEGYSPYKTGRFRIHEFEETYIPRARLTLDPRDPMRSAREFRQSRRPNLVCFAERREWYELEPGTRNVKEIERGTLEAQVWGFLDDATSTKGGRFKPTTAKVREVLQALRALTIRKGGVL